MQMKLITRIVGISVCAALFGFGLFQVAHADVLDQISGLNARIKELEQERAAYQAQADHAGQQSRTLQNEIAKFNAQINSITAQIRSLEANIELTDLEIGTTEEHITEAERLMAVHRGALGKFLQEYSEFDERGVATILLGSERLSDFFDHLNNLERSQIQLQGTINAIYELRTELDGERELLQEQQESLERLKAIHEVDQRGLSSKKYEKNTLLKVTKGQEDKFQGLVSESTGNIGRLREQIFYLRQAGISVEDAVSAAKFAAVGAGIRPAFLLALLEVESRLGQNVGSGNWQDDMVLCYRRLGDIWYPNRRDHFYKRAATEEAAFLKITSSLGLDPGSVKVSKEPTYGCGGAMGPAQFIPSTWLAYQAEVARLTGHNPPSPWNTQDAFTAAAIKLARGGATTRAGEEGAARAYVGGSTKCGISSSTHICTVYSRTVLQKAAEIEKNL